MNDYRCYYCNRRIWIGTEAYEIRHSNEGDWVDVPSKPNSVGMSLGVERVPACFCCINQGKLIRELSERVAALEQQLKRGD